MNKDNKIKNLKGTESVVVLNTDLGKLEGKEKHTADSRQEMRGLYGKEAQFYDFYFIPSNQRA